MKAAISGLLTGIAAGFVGVGGGEFRIPVLVRILRFPLKVASGINLLVGLFTVVVSAYRRWGTSTLNDDAVVLLSIMAVASIVGAVLGVRGRQRFPARPLSVFVRGYLIIVGLWMLYESAAHADHVLLDPAGMSRWALAGIIAFAIAGASGVLGVAGGEMRIPALMYLFGLPIVEAGTLSLIVSIPTLASGAVTDRKLGGLPDFVLRGALSMGVASAIGVVLGAALIPYADRHIIKGALGVVLLLSALRLTSHGARIHQPEMSPP